MKQLVCEMCTGTELVEQNGVYVCQHCGAKFIDNSDVKNSDKLNNLYLLARRARDNNNKTDAAKFYDMILYEDANSWEAAYYSVYYKFNRRQFTTQDAANAIRNCIHTVLTLIKQYVIDENKQNEAINEIVKSVLDTMNNFLTLEMERSSSEIKQKRNLIIGAIMAFTITAYNLGNELESIFSDREYTRKLAVYAWKAGVNLHSAAMQVAGRKEEDSLSEYINKIKKYDAFYQMPYYPIPHTLN